MTTPTDTAKAREISEEIYNTTSQSQRNDEYDKYQRKAFYALVDPLIAAALAAERERVMAMVYAKDAFSIERMSACLAVALVCDEELDKSGALLGRVRKQAAAIRQALTGETK